jgi:hypothetical protein
MPEPSWRQWDGATYDRVSTPQARWGTAVLGRLALRGDEAVLDCGCGSGRVTEQLLAGLPRGKVIALDASRSMLDQARRRLAVAGERVGSWRPTCWHCRRPRSAMTHRSTLCSRARRSIGSPITASKGAITEDAAGRTVTWEPAGAAPREPTQNSIPPLVEFGAQVGVAQVGGAFGALTPTANNWETP